jgi:hypothetical protein
MASGLTNKGREVGRVTQGIVPPFTEESALAKVQVAEELWNTRDPERIVLAYTGRLGVAESVGVPQGPEGDPCISAAEVGARAGLPAQEDAVGISPKPDGGEL